MTKATFCRSCPGGVQIRLIVLPRSSKAAIVGIHNNALKIKLTKAPVDGAANDECCRLMAKTFNVPISAVRIVRGATSRHKLVSIAGIDEKNIRDMFG
ncbi:MAG: DUF167 domain-containing protein [Desulfobacterota bacterium]|nr:DUF167 domain-containing protein [Thermodesulfobacteriota bacterium]